MFSLRSRGWLIALLVLRSVHKQTIRYVQRFVASWCTSTRSFSMLSFTLLLLLLLLYYLNVPFNLGNETGSERERNTIHFFNFSFFSVFRINHLWFQLCGVFMSILIRNDTILVLRKFYVLSSKCWFHFISFSFRSLKSLWYFGVFVPLFVTVFQWPRNASWFAYKKHNSFVGNATNE